MRKRINLTGKQLRAIILSHGWFDLQPFNIELKKLRFVMAFDLPIGSGAFEIKGNKRTCSIQALSGTTEICMEVIRRCLSTDISLTSTYDQINKQGKEFEWIINNDLGRFLRSASLYEDCFKAILTTNTTWSRTANMVRSVVEIYGKSIDGIKAFPSSYVMLSTSEKSLLSKIGCGFRARYLLGLAKAASTEPDIFFGDAWQQLSNEEFYEKLINLKGLGPASVNYISLLYWKPNGFTLDAYTKRRCRELWGLSEKNILPFISKRYSYFEKQAPLVFWFEITRHWHKKAESEIANDW